MRKSLGTVLTGLAIALAGAALAQGSGKYDGQYVGELTLAGIVNGDCTQPPVGALYPLTIAGGQVRFKYVPRFDTTLIGKVDQNGDFKAGRRLRHGFVTMTGHIDARGATGYITSPSCNYTFKTRN